MKLEKMSDFFTTRIDGYDEHMLNEVEGCREGYIKMAKLLPPEIDTLLDLGCGTGLELDEIFKIMPQISVTGIDLTQVMLDRLRSKHPSKKMKLICGNYFDVDFGHEAFDCSVSFQTMHHFSHEEKHFLYKKIFDSLKQNGLYIECDYMVQSQAEEDFFYSENSRLRREAGVSANEFYHFDTPCTIQNQITMLKLAGFVDVNSVFRIGNTTIVTAKK